MKAVLVCAKSRAASGPATPGNETARSQDVTESKDNIGKAERQGFTPEAISKLAAMQDGKEPYSERVPLNWPDDDPNDEFDFCYEFIPAVVARATHNSDLVVIAFQVSAFLQPPDAGERGLICANSFVPDYGFGKVGIMASIAAIACSLVGRGDVHKRAVQIDADVAELLAAYREDGESHAVRF